MITEIFQTYEGELLLAGPKKLLWHNVSINPQTIQVLPKKKRVFPFAPPSTCVDTDDNGIDESRLSTNLRNDKMKKKKIDDMNHKANSELKTMIQKLSNSPFTTFCIGLFIGFTISRATVKSSM